MLRSIYEHMNEDEIAIDTTNDVQGPFRKTYILLTRAGFTLGAVGAMPIKI